MGRRVSMMISFVLVLFAVFESEAGKWGRAFNDGEVVHSCVGKRVAFPWHFRPSAGEQIVFTRWTFQGAFTTRALASLSREDFLPSVEYAKRVEQVGTVGVALRRVTVGDSGNYTVEISGLSATGDYFTVQRVAVLQVADKLLAQDSKVTLTQKAEAVKVKDTGKWAAALQCGRFTYHGVPPFPVYWTTPSGDVIKKSDEFSDGSYVLLLPNPVRGGNYSCEIPWLFRGEACLPGDSESNVKATIDVDEIQVRFTLIEAHQGDLLKENAQKTEELNTLRSALALHVNESAGTAELVQNQLKSLESAIADTAAKPVVVFSAKTTTNQMLRGVQPLKFNRALNNQGNGFSVSTGEFTAPVGGTYFFAFHTNSQSDDASSRVVVNGRQEICSVSISSDNRQGSCQGVARLAKGDKVWVEPFGHFNGVWSYRGPTTWFLGFLIGRDPV